MTLTQTPMTGRSSAATPPTSRGGPIRTAAADARLARFLRATGEPSLDALQARATADPAWFWGAATDDIAIPWTRRPREIADLSGGPAWARWWIGGSFDWSWAAVEPRAARDPDGIADHLGGRGRHRSRTLTNGELATAVRRAARAARGRSVSARATGSGSSCRCCSRRSSRSSRSAASGRSSRRSSRATPRRPSRRGSPTARRSCSITADGFLRRGVVGRPQVGRRCRGRGGAVGRARARRAARRRRPRGALDGGSRRPLGATRPGDGTSADRPADRDPETPYMIIYTSGTTGRPKGAVHVHGGFPIKAAQDLAHTFDLTERDTLFWFTDLGWMMGPWAIAGSLLLGARLVLYEGAPDFPAPDRLWSLVERHRVTHLGLSPTVIRALMAHGEEPGPVARSLVAPRARLDRGAVEPRAVVVVLPRGRRGPLPDRQLQRRDRGQWRHRRRQRDRADQAGQLLRAVHRDGRRTSSTTRARPSAARSASWSSAHRCRA